MFVLVVADVSGRELFGSSFRFTIATVEYAMLYMTMFAAPWLMRTNGHVYIEALITRLPNKIRNVLEKIVYIVGAAACFIFAASASQMFFQRIASGELDIRSIDIPGWVIFAPMPICFAMVAFEFLRFLFGPNSMWSNMGGAQDVL